MRMRVSTLVLLFVGCNGGDKTPPDTTPDTTPPVTTTPLEQVMRNCPTDVGTICPYVGAGYGGRNELAGRDKLDVWLSFPMSIAFPPEGTDGNPVLADWNNHRLLQILPSGELEVVMGTEFLGDGDPLQADKTPEGAPGTSVALNHPTQQMWF
jgi:hypothetical protein